MKILAIGDSITRADGVPLGYPGVIESLLAGFEIANAGCDGSTTRDWTTAWSGGDCVIDGAFELLAEPADITTIMLGVNDSVGFFEDSIVAASEYIWRVEEIAARAHLELGSEEIIVLIPPVNPIGGISPIPIDEYAQEAEVLCERVDYISCGPNFTYSLDASHFSDSVHPNQIGHNLIGEEIARYILVPEPNVGTLLAIGILILSILSYRRAKKCRK